MRMNASRQKPHCLSSKLPVRMRFLRKGRAMKAMDQRIERRLAAREKFSLLLKSERETAAAISIQKVRHQHVYCCRLCIYCFIFTQTSVCSPPFGRTRIQTNSQRTQKCNTPTSVSKPHTIRYSNIFAIPT